MATNAATTKATSKAATTKATSKAATPVATNATVALRGGPAVQTVVLTGKPYRSAAAHNTAWWAQIAQASASGPTPVAPLLAAGVPAHFVGYTMRRGYLQAA